MVKKVHLALSAVNQKISRLREELEKEQTKVNKTKKKRIYSQLGHLKKAAQDPERFIVDPEIKMLQRKEQKQKRMKMKKEKKKQATQRQKQKRQDQRCLKCGSKDHLLGNCVSTVMKFEIQKKNEQSIGVANHMNDSSRSSINQEIGFVERNNSSNKSECIKQDSSENEISYESYSDEQKN